MKPSPPAKASTRRCAAACSFLHRWPPRPADHARSAWTSLPQRTKLLPWLGHTNHTDEAIVGTGCCGDWCRCAKGNGPPPERTSPGKHCRPVGVVPDRDSGGGQLLPSSVDQPPIGIWCPTWAADTGQTCAEPMIGTDPAQIPVLT